MGTKMTMQRAEQCKKKKGGKEKSNRGLESFQGKGFSIEEMVSIIVMNVKMGDIRMRMRA